MNNDAEAINQFLAWLLQDPGSTVTAPSGDKFSPDNCPDESGTATPLPYLDPLDSEEGRISAFSPESGSSANLISSSMGEIPAVQDHFHALLKRRLRAEIEQNPPLFPWETHLSDYETDWLTTDFTPTPVWAAHLQQLHLPMPVPQPVLETLLQQCRELVRSSLQEGAKLVQAVESLFPGQASTLNQLADLVLTTPVRGAVSAPAPLKPYEEATPKQQMALSLVAARELLNTLTLKLSPHQTHLDRQWLTAYGVLKLQVAYQTTQHLQIQVQLPCAGRLSVEHEDVKLATADRSNAGEICLQVPIELEQRYSLSIQFAKDAATEAPLQFAIYTES